MAVGDRITEAGLAGEDLEEAVFQAEEEVLGEGARAGDGNDMAIRPIKLFSNDEKNRIISAIKEAEGQTSGEIRVHVDNSSMKDPLRRARIVFEKIGMTKTKLRNGVLIYINPAGRRLAIIGDKGIDGKVGSDFWERQARAISGRFADGKYIDGALETIKSIAEALADRFPRQSDDVNELRDDISCK